MLVISFTTDLLANCWRYLILGIIQGLTEFLPISSTAHLKAIPTLIGWSDPGISVTAVLQLGSIFAVITYFRKDLKAVLKGIALAFRHGQWKDPYSRLGIAIIAGTIPIVTIGLTIKLLWIEFGTSQLRGIPSIAIISILMAVLLALAEKIGSQRKIINNVSIKDGLIVGLTQTLAIIPGVSRSGITISAALLYGWTRKDAARFSFLLGIPAIMLSGLAEVKAAFNTTFRLEVGILPLLIGVTSSALVSWIAIDWLLKYLQRHSTWIFVIYRIVFGITLISWYWLSDSQSI